MQRDVSGQGRHAGANAAKLRRSATSTKHRANFVSLLTGQTAFNFVFGHGTQRTTRELATSNAGEQTTAAESLQNDRDGHGHVSVQGTVRCAERLLAEGTVVGITLASINHTQTGPVPRLADANDRTSATQRRRRKHARQPARRLIQAASLPDHLGSVPRRRRFRTQALVIGVEH